MFAASDLKDFKVLSYLLPFRLDSLTAEGKDEERGFEVLPLTVTTDSLTADGKVPPIDLLSLEKADEKRRTDQAKDEWYKDPKQFCKVVLPHIVLIGTLLAYISLVALAMCSIEASRDIELRQQRMKQLLTHYDAVVNETWRLHMSSDCQQTTSFDAWRTAVNMELRQLSDFLEIPQNISSVETRWTFPSAVLYTLTIITTCGFDHVVVNTDAGRVFSVAFALVGIPLVFITAADIGKFLSDAIGFIARKTRQIWKYAKKKVKCTTNSPVSATSNGTILSNRRRSSQADDTQQLHSEDQDLEPDLDPELNPDLEQDTKLWIPVLAYVGLICFYCVIGSALYCLFEPWYFLRAFHFSFNAITTVGLGDIAVTSYIYLALNVAYVIVGLAVVTMCIDLASTHLKAYFAKLHYSGRPQFQAVGEEIKDLMRIIAELRKRKRGKEVTWDDIMKYKESQLLASLVPYAPNFNFRYIDETSSMDSTTRSRAYSASSGEPETLTTTLGSKKPRRLKDSEKGEDL